MKETKIIKDIDVLGDVTLEVLITRSEQYETQNKARIEEIREWCLGGENFGWRAYRDVITNDLVLERW